ncbi:TIGR01621 family pseudouridine synthase [Alteromonas pelagimontana]|uniref:TIGR01621 family pseudouridine synthase n=1 Tax=Alteromonas pelagimontana TaxID=1858656 RepID=A0A6M4M9T9_9ALTE|nr:TIGR01621 family pseudouridine synthase [Alteromonas pelagimontana]QJR79923.1 TIGR01621 family pseudouridine synthase [Alteromonas pelagimontana]
MNPIPVVHTHKDFIVINKPSGIAMHDPENGILAVLQRQLNLQGMHLCHRLDTVTSGCLLLARNAQAAAIIGDLFANRLIQKFYIAQLSKKPNKKQGTIAGDMKNRRRGQHVLLKSKDNPAVTQFFSSTLSSGERVAIVKPLTGKTHQIRVAMKSVGSPIVGDELYGGTPADRTYLHAWGLQFIYQAEEFQLFASPQYGQSFTHSAFAKWLSELDSPAKLPWPRYQLPSNMSDKPKDNTDD